MSRNVRTYDHFCLLARALERVGDRWSLLVVRDLLSGSKRFTDLMDRLGGITPKTLTQRLRELEDAGIVAADREPGRREVWYRLTPAGAELGPAIEALSWWGFRHAWRPPRAGEQLHAEHLLRAVVQLANRTGNDLEPARWHFRVRDDGDYLVESDGRGWSLSASEPREEADLTITANTGALIEFFRDPDPRQERDRQIDIRGDRNAIRRLTGMLRTFRDTTTRRTASPAQKLNDQDQTRGQR